MSISPASLPSLPEVHASVGVQQPSIWKRIFAFAGPAYLVSVGYMDPGNWATDLEGGARFGYQLLWVLVVSNAMAILLQTLSARLGIVAGRDLAQACREAYPRPVSLALWVLCEIAIAAMDLAEVLGAAIGLKLLFGINLLTGVMLTALDTLLVLWFMRFGIRRFEAFVLSLISIIAGCFLLEMWFAKPVLGELVKGLVPRLNGESLYVAIGILGATVMPHNLYLHGALVQTRQIGKSVGELKAACRYNLVDSIVALNAALLVNGAILILAASTFYSRGIVVSEIEQAHEMLSPLLGTTLASAAFAVALLASGQSSTMTGTMAGQIVMEGFLRFRMRPWLRRLMTRTLAIIPAAITVYISGEAGSYKLLILSQVILSMQLPFAVIPLIHFSSDRKLMGEFVNATWVRVLAWTAASIIVALNIWLVIQTFGEWIEAAGPWLWAVLGPLAVALGALLVWVSAHPWMPEKWRKLGSLGIPVPEAKAQVTEVAAPQYRTLLVPLDHTDADKEAVGHAMALAKVHGSKVVLVHVEEGVTSQVYGEIASTAEVKRGRGYFGEILDRLHAAGIDAELIVRHAANPGDEIVSVARSIAPDLIVMGAHGHRGLKDLVFGQTIQGVRHELAVPLLIVRGDKGDKAGGD